MIVKVFKYVIKGHAMLGKALGIVTAGIFMGAAVVEITNLRLNKSDKKDPADGSEKKLKNTDGNNALGIDPILSSKKETR